MIERSLPLGLDPGVDAGFSKKIRKNILPVRENCANGLDLLILLTA
jgi:hypothetical protein